MRRWSREQRLRLLVETLEGADVSGAPRSDDLIARAAAGVEGGGDPAAWLALAVLRAELPLREDVVGLRRMIRTRGSIPAIEQLTRARRSNPVRVLQEAVVVDVHHTARTGLATGIQRVVRETIRRWVTDHRVSLVGWNDLYRGVHELSRDEQASALTGSTPNARHRRGAEVLIPWRSLYVLPELAIEPERTQRIQALAEFSGNRTAVVGFDCVPLTSAETTSAGMATAFAKNLRAVAEMDRVAAISSAAATEYQGWREMLAAIGIEGPDVTEVILPDVVGTPTDEELATARGVLGIVDDLPLLLCVGSHEPRKNHIAVLHAAEHLWRSGREFRLVFIGGNAWRSRSFFHELGLLREHGRSVHAVTAVSDGVLWSAYRLATATVFPSLNEGFGLPVAESLAAGTPAVTSNFGSMEEIARSGGAVLVDPRDDRDLARGMEIALFDPQVQAALRDATRTRPRRTWEDYASDLWDVVVG